MIWTKDAIHRVSAELCEFFEISHKTHMSPIKASFYINKMFESKNGEYLIGSKLISLGTQGPTLKFCDVDAFLDRHMSPFVVNESLIERMRRAMLRGENVKWCLSIRNIVFVFEGNGEKGYEFEIAASTIQRHDSISSLKILSDYFLCNIRVDSNGETISPALHSSLMFDGFESIGEDHEIEYIRRAG